MVNYQTVVSLTGSHPPPSLAAHRVVHPAHGAMRNNSNTENSEQNKPTS